MGGSRPYNPRPRSRGPSRSADVRLGNLRWFRAWIHNPQVVVLPGPHLPVPVSEPQACGLRPHSFQAGYLRRVRPPYMVSDAIPVEAGVRRWRWRRFGSVASAGADPPPDRSYRRCQLRDACVRAPGVFRRKADWDVPFSFTRTGGLGPGAAVGCTEQRVRCRPTPCRSLLSAQGRASALPVLTSTERRRGSRVRSRAAAPRGFPLRGAYAGERN